MMMMMMMMTMTMMTMMTVLLTESSALASGTERASPCPPRWLLLGRRCYALHPVWSSWTNAELMCSQSGGSLASLHTQEEVVFVRQLSVTHAQVWLGGGQQMNGSWFWSDGSSFRISGWTNQRQGKAREGGACMAMTPKSGELSSAPCGELRFYICSTRARKPVNPRIVPGGSLFDVVWGYSANLAEEILHSSSFLRQLRSGNLTRRCYDSFLQQEALYLHRVSSTLEVLIGSLQEADDVTSLLLDTLKRYSRNQESLLLPPPPPQWLQSSLLSFHQVVLEEPVYWLVALSARPVLRHFLSQELVSRSEVTAGHLREWSEDTLTEVTWMHRYRKLVEERQGHMDVFQAVNVFRDHMTNQRSLHRAV
uniref:C-type lectin domain-containing protein n=1 Tax=Cyclopterus lumpus TaxID=8103 RepID=A0A8C3A009_CYCLU